MNKVLNEFLSVKKLWSRKTNRHFRFAQFFIAPLFTSDATDREMNAIDSGKLSHDIQIS